MLRNVLTGIGAAVSLVGAAAFVGLLVVVLEIGRGFSGQSGPSLFSEREGPGTEYSLADSAALAGWLVDTSAVRSAAGCQPPTELRLTLYESRWAGVRVMAPIVRRSDRAEASASARSAGTPNDPQPECAIDGATLAGALQGVGPVVRDGATLTLQRRRIGSEARDTVATAVVAGDTVRVWRPGANAGELRYVRQRRGYAR